MKAARIRTRCQVLHFDVTWRADTKPLRLSEAAALVAIRRTERARPTQRPKDVGEGAHGENRRYSPVT